MTAESVPVRQAATILLLRDSDAGAQVYMLRRNRRTVFGPGMYVFPGGALDPEDSHADLLTRCDGLSPERAVALLGGASAGLALWVAAIRECFEEAGVLVATDTRGRDLEMSPALAEARDALNAGQLGFSALCERFELRLPVERLHYFSHWVTPRGAPKRYSTRFFACRVAAGQQARHDGHEAVAGEWITPAEAVARYEAGDMPMMPPTIVQLRFLEGYASGSDAMRALEDAALSRQAEPETAS